MQVIPVIDILEGTVVHAVRGERERYRPLASPLAPSSRPHDVLVALDKRCRPASVYVADLDALLGGEPDAKTLVDLAEIGPRLIVDAGVRSLAEALVIGGFGVDVVVALETVPGPALLAEVLGLVGPERVVFSLDLRGGEPLGAVEPWGGADPLGIAARAVKIGVRRVIVLDLASVGSGEGPSQLALIRELRESHPALEIISGGGVRSRTDLDALDEAGANAALVATALHDGSLVI